LPLELVKFDESAATAYGQIQTGLEREEKVIESMDMLIAAHAGTGD
jgi:tRNA(fMet)-specific endonuclease VapC